MKLCKIIAIIDELKLEAVEEQLAQHNVKSFTLHAVRGRGRYFDSFNKNRLLKHLQIEIYVPETQSSAICRVIVDAAHCGADSEGLVSVIPVNSLYWVHEKREAHSNDFQFSE